MRAWSEQEYAEWLRKRGISVSPPFKLPANEAGSFALGRLPQGWMNKTETAYAAHLEELKQAGEILWWKFEAIKLRLAEKTFYTADFFVMAADRSLEVHEVKGYWQDDARVKIKVAASIYPFKFIGVQKAGSTWKREEFSS